MINKINMNKKTVIISASIFILLLAIFAICKLFITKPEKELMITEKETLEIKTIAQKNIKILAQKLMKELKSNIKKGGVIQGAKFCSNSATKIEESVSKILDKGVSVTRVSLKNRNMNNYPTKVFDKNILIMIEKDIKDKKNIKPMIIKKISDNHYKAYKLIFMKPLCLKCHGDTTTMNKEAYNIIKKHYPEDKAIDYKIGDFRGVFLVDIYK